jgi:GxxExxY protein
MTAQCTNGPHSESTGRIIIAAMRVHTALGPGYRERICENALICELTKAGTAARQQVRYTVVCDAAAIGEHVPDIVVEDEEYMELKCQKPCGLETAQVLSGLKASGLRTDLLINSNCVHLRNGIQGVGLPDHYLQDSGK